MKKYLLAIGCIIGTLYSQAQVVSVPDTNFLNLLVNDYNINKNKDGYIQVSEASAVTNLVISSNKPIKNLTGLEAFINLYTLSCNYTQVDTLNLTKNTHIGYLYLDNNEFKTIDLSKNIYLGQLNCSACNLVHLDLSNNINLKDLDCSENQLSSLDVSKNTLLKDLVCGNNQISKLDLSKNTELQGLNCSNNHISELDVSYNLNLTNLTFDYNTLGYLDVSKNNYLSSISCKNNPLTSINLGNLNVLRYLNCESTNLTSLDLRYDTVLSTLDCRYCNFLTQICINKKQISDTVSYTNWHKADKAKYYLDCDFPTGLDDIEIQSSPKSLVRVYTPLGQAVLPENAINGMFIYQYSDGTTKKVLK